MRSVLPALLLVCAGALAAQTPAPTAANADPTYQQLRHVTVGTEAVTVTNVVLNREGGRFTLRSGTVYFLAPVNGRVTGAVFIGDGIFTLAPPISIERSSLARLTGGREFVENYAHLLLRFTDGTYDELKKAGTATTGSTGEAASVLEHVNDELRTKLHYNLHGRILQDVAGGTGGLFYAFINGKNYNGDMVFAIDPHGLRDLGVAPEEVALLTFDLQKFGIWAAYHRPSEYAAGTATGTEKNALVYDSHQKLDTTIDKSAYLHGDAMSTLIAGSDGLRVVPLDLFPKLRVKSVTDSTGQALAFIQEDWHDDPDFFVILPKALNKNEQFTLHTLYEGKDAVKNEGGGNYFPVARDDWYPNTFFGDYATYDLTFHVAKGLQMVATGEVAKDSGDGVTEWQTPVPISVAGFNFGRYKKVEAKLDKLGIVVDAYANEDQPDWVRGIQNAVTGADTPTLDPGSQGLDENYGGAMGLMDTRSMIKKPLSEAQLAMQIYTDYFGPVSYKHVAMSQQTDCGFGQSWPTLVYVPMCAMLDTTTRHQLGLDQSFNGIDLNGTYWNAVGAHEVAHQWWGHTVGFASYRDQWMSEGFADLSTSIFIQAIYTANKGAAYDRFWNDMLRELTYKNPEGRRPIDVGPVTLGYRLNNSKSGFDIAQRLIYPKGAYILHMVRMMMWNTKTGDANFKAMMHDFVDTYRNKPATTEDFKAMVEKHMTPDMDLARNGKLDWFFNEYVYGTALPNYHTEFSFGQQPDGTPNLHLKIVQSNVDQRFGIIVPIYLELANGKIIRLGTTPMVGNSTLDQVIPLNGLREPPKRAMINYFHDVLATSD